MPDSVALWIGALGAFGGFVCSALGLWSARTKRRARLAPAERESSDEREARRGQRKSLSGLMRRFIRDYGLFVSGLGLMTLSAALIYTHVSGAATLDTSTCEKTFRITYPPNGFGISQKSGVEVRGTACNSDYVWVFDFDLTDGYYYRDSPAPILVL